MSKVLELRSDCPLEVQFGVKAFETELIRATRKFGPFASTHEGWAVIREEVDELWEAIKAKADTDTLRREAIQVGASALRFLVDCAPRLELEEDGEEEAALSCETCEHNAGGGKCHAKACDRMA